MNFFQTYVEEQRDNSMKRIIVIMTLIFLLTAIVTATSSCGKTDTSGIVSSKTYEPENRFIMFIPIMVGKVMIMIPIWMFDDEDYIIKIAAANKDGKTVYVNYYVDKFTYGRAEIGEWFDPVSAAKQPASTVSITDANERIGKATQEEVDMHGATS